VKERLSIRTFAGASALVFGALSLLVVIALIWGSTRMGRATTAGIRGEQARALASELQLSFLTYHRLSHIYVITGAQDAAAARAELAEEMRLLLAQAETYRGSAEERRLLDGVSERLDAYLQQLREIEEGGAEPQEVVEQMVPAVDETVSALESLRDLHDTHVQAAHAEVLRMDRLSTLIGLSAGALLLLALLGSTYAVGRLLLRPMLDLHETVGRLRQGERDARADAVGLREISELGRGLNEMADALARQREQQFAFLAGVAHDLRNPLHALKLGIGTLEHQQSEAARRSTCARLDRQMDRLARMVEDLLDATRIEAGKLDMRMETVDVRDRANEIVRLYEPTSPDHPIVVEQPRWPVMVEGDPLRLEQALSNLLSNAIKFSPSGSPVVVRVGTEEGHAVVSVVDRGVGIERDELPELFTPFRRARTDVAPGVGLGLSLARHIATAHGGVIEVESVPGRGSTFRLRMPLAHLGEPGGSDARPMDSADAG
jgi:signal transduction histidine kinase